MGKKSIAGSVFLICLFLFWGTVRAQMEGEDPAQMDEHAGLIIVKSSRGVEETVTALEEALQGRGLEVMGRIDHSENAAKAGLFLPPTVLVLFGNPDVGTRLMLAARPIGLDLPQKMLVWQNDQGVWVGYKDPTYLALPYAITDVDEILARMAETMADLAETVAGR